MGMTSTIAHAAEPRFSYSVPATVPAPWRRDVSKIESVLKALSARHSAQELAQLLVLAATRSLPQGKRPGNGIGAAMLRGVLARENLKNEEGGSISTEEARRFLGGISKSMVLERHKRGELLGWRETRQNAVRFPVWQFTAEGVLPGLQDVLAILRSSPAVDDWGAIVFFLNKRTSLNQERPLDVLRRGDVEAVKQAARGHVE
jgi:hypothetical protein